MCGILGVFDPAGLASMAEQVQRANDAAHHRGPDDGNFAWFSLREDAPARAERGSRMPTGDRLSDCQLVFGHRRLSILDLSDAGSQPMKSGSGKLWITFNGEIYNYVELRQELSAAGYRFQSHGDTEVILAAWQHWGEACVERFNGMWAFVLVDLERKVLFCSRDRFGIKPLHYYTDGRRFAFASEIKQLLHLPFVPRAVNSRAVFEFLAYQAVEYDEETFFAGIHKLRHGHNLIVDLRTGEHRETQYYQPKFELNSQRSYGEAAEEFRRLLTDSVRLQLRSDVEVGSCLSGGLDSSSLVCLIHDILGEQGQGHRQRTFSTHFDEDEANERVYMDAVIRATGVTAAFTQPNVDDFLKDLGSMVRHQEEPFASTSIFAQWAVFKLVGTHGVKVMLDGQGADEQLAGYLGLIPYFFQELKSEGSNIRWTWERFRDPRIRTMSWAARLAQFRRSMLRPAPSSAVPPSGIRPEFAARHQHESHYVANQQIRPYGADGHLNNVLYQLTFLNNLQSLLKYADRNSMAFSVESRVPFLDHRLVEFAFTLPVEYKVRNGYTKRVLRDAMTNVIPRKIRLRVGKLGFATPERAWRRTVMRPLLEQAWAENRLSEYIDPQQARVYYDHLVERDVADSTPWRWLSLHLWKQAYDL